MATLENIRKRGPLVAAVIGFALLAFILGDFSKIFNSGNPYVMAEVNGVEIDSRDYEEQVQTTINTYKANYNIQSLTQSQTDQIREMVWNNMVQKILLEEQYEAIGLDVSSDELFELMQGRNVDPMVMQERAFINEQTGMFDPSRVIMLYKNINEMDEQSKAYLLDLENRVRENRKIRKYLSMIAKGLYVPTPLVEKEFKNRNYLVDFDYVGKGYSTIPDSSVKINDDDLRAYYNEHKDEYEQEAARDIVYVTFDIIPSAEDTLNTFKDITEIKSKFIESNDVQQFLRSYNSDESFNPKHFKKGEFENPEVDSFLFAVDTGEVYGPYYEAGAYKLAKLVEVKDLPDSIEAKHILIAINQQSIPDLTKAKQIADSLKQAIESGIDFAIVAKEYSADQQTMEKGGELGWITEDQKLIFDTLLNSGLNKIVTLEQNYGVHLLVKTDQSELHKKVQAAFFTFDITPGKKTRDEIYRNAVRFANNRTLDKFEKAANEGNLTKRIAPGLTRNGTFIPGLEGPRPLIRWAFKAKRGDVSEVYTFGNRHVVGAVTEIREKGIAPLEQVKNRVQMGVLKEKKAEVLLKQMQEAMSADLPSLAQKMGLEVKEAKNISFTSRQIPGMGVEPAVIAKAVTSEKGKVSAPIKGESGVYAIKVKVITPSMSTENVDLEIDRKRLLQTLQSRIYPNPQYGGTGEVIGALKESADIDDEKRSDFY